MSGVTNPETAPTCTIAEASAATGVPVDTLRYYERAGVIPPIGRTVGGQRAFSQEDLGWITFVRRLRSTGMSMRRLADYAAMVRAGQGTMAERRQLLVDHRATVAAAIEELTTALEVLDGKIGHYEAVEQGLDVDCVDTPLRHVTELG